MRRERGRELSEGEGRIGKSVEDPSPCLGSEAELKSWREIELN